jgi:type I restriction enzyme R subunit
VRSSKGARNTKTIRHADYVLSFKPDVPLAIVEAKNDKHTMRDGIQQVQQQQRWQASPCCSTR